MKIFALAAALILIQITNMSAETIYDIPVKDSDGKSTTLSPYKGKAVLIVNVASHCGYTPQYAGLESLYLKYKDQGFTVLAFPCNQFGNQEPGSMYEIKLFCSSKYNVTFPLFEKIEVNGDNRHPLYAFLTGPNSPYPGNVTWNFNKFLVGKNGSILKRFDSKVAPDSEELTKAVEAALQSPRVSYPTFTIQHLFISSRLDPSRLSLHNRPYVSPGPVSSC